MSGFSAIDLSLLPAPDVIETVAYAEILSALRNDLLARGPELAAALALESEPINKLLEVCAYRETIIRARVNDAGRAVMLAYATGGDLDHLAAFFGVVRLLVTPADPTATPPVSAVYETDARLRIRTQLALVWSTVESNQGFVEGSLIVFFGTNERFCNRTVHIRYRIGHAFAAESVLVTVAQFDCLMRSCRCA